MPTCQLPDAGHPANLYVSGVLWDPPVVRALLGLIDCDPRSGCTVCCARVDYARVQEPELERIAEHTGRAAERLRRKWRVLRDGEVEYRIPQPCEFLRPGQGCSIHPARMVVCRLFPLVHVDSPEGPRIGVATEWCDAGRPIIARLEALQEGRA